MNSRSTIPDARIPDDILKDSVLAQLAATYFEVAFILSSLSRDTALNQNQVAKRLGFDRTVVHRAIKAMLKEGLVSERKAKSGRALLLHLTPKGEKYHQVLIEHRRSADEKVRQALTAGERASLIHYLKRLAEMKF